MSKYNTQLRMKVVIIGSGFAGATTAYLLRERMGASVTILEKSKHAGGMLRTLYSESGLPYEYGPRVLSVFRGTPDGLDFVRRFVELGQRDVYQGTLLQRDYNVVPFPLDRECLASIPEGDTIRAEMQSLENTPIDETNLRTYLETSLGPTLTKLAFAGFNRKFWGRELEELPASWGMLRRLGRITEKGTYRLPSMAPHYYPTGGFNPLFRKLLADFPVRYGSDVHRVEASEDGTVLHCDDGQLLADLVISTAPIDRLLGYSFGQLEWRGYRVELEAAESGRLGNAPDGIPFAWLYTPSEETDICRTTDFGVIHHGSGWQGKAVIAREIPDQAVSMYPVSWEEQRFDRYLAKAAKLRGFIPLGRLGLYKYVTVDSTFAMVERLMHYLPRYHETGPDERFAILKKIRGDWTD